jgi:hemerythrin superfamily protein
VSADVDAIALLEEQHREVEKLFAALETAEGVRKRKQFADIADKLAIHATLEERHFYPEVKAKGTEEILLESLEEHLGIKRVLTDLLAVDVGDATFDAKVKVLREQVEHHVGEEERDLFPEVRRLIDEPTLIAIAQLMIATQEELLAEGEPRQAVPPETKHAAEL